MSCLEISTWATEMFGTCELGDKRRPKRLIKIAEWIAANPSASFPNQTDFGCNRQIEGARPTGNGSGSGFLLHNALLVDAATEAVLGLAGQAVHYRPEEPTTSKCSSISSSRNVNG